MISIAFQNEGHIESDSFFLQLLGGLGNAEESKETYANVPILSNNSAKVSNENILISPTAHFKQSAYSVPGWADTRWKYRKNITIDNSKVSADLTNFPVLIDLYDSDFQNDAQASGNDIFFTNSTGHILDHEIELYDRVYNSTHAHLVAWVKTNLSNSQDTIISMYYGNPTIENQENPAGVWSSNYEAVFHLNDDPTGTVYDSTANNNNGTSAGSMTSDDQLEGILDGSIDFDGSNDLINIGDVNSDLWSEVTVQAWIFHDASGDDRIVCKSASTTTTAHIISLALFPSGAYDVLRVRLATDGVGGSPAASSQDSATQFTRNTWHHVAFTWDSTSETIYLYIDGSQDSNSFSKDGDSIDDSTLPVILANVNTGAENRYYDGRIDETRLSSVARSANWISTEYNNQDDPNNFYTIGEKESSPDYWAYNSYKYRKQFTIDATKVSDDLTNFPVLIFLNDTDLHDSAKVQTDGDDLVFTTTSGLKLDHEIELFDQTGNGTHAHLVAWVRVPSLSATDDTDLLMYYGNKAAGNQENPEGVWDANYVGVWHLNEQNGNAIDSTNYGNEGIPAGGVTQGISGQIDYAYDFDGINDHVVISDPGIGSVFDFNTENNITISAWIRPESFPDQWNTFLTKGSTPSAFANFGCQVVDNDLDGIDGALDFFYRDSIDTNWNEYQTSAEIISTDNWYHVVFVYTFGTGNSLKIFVNGAEISGSWTSRNGNDDPLVSNAELWFGADDNAPYGSPNELFDGIIDEIRLSNAYHSADWISTEYNNHNDPDTFFSVGNEEENSNYWADKSFSYRKTIVIDKDKVSANLTNFPVLIDLTDNNLKSGRVQSDADDIIFTDQSGTILDHEVEYFSQNSSLGSLIAWVRVPSLSSISDTNITMYYGNSAVGDQQKPTDVWDSNYVGIWHMNQDPAGPSPQIIDSSSLSSNGTSYGSMSSSDLIEGEIDGSIHFDGNNDYINIGNPTELQISGAITVESWVRADLVGNDYVIAKMGLGGQRGWDISFDDDPGISPDGWVMFRYSIDGSAMKNVGYERINASLWYHVVGVYNPSTYARFYLNGQLVAEDTTNIPSSQFDPSVPVRFATRADSSGFYNGTLDEIRISNFVRSSDWIATEYKNQHDPNSFYSVTSEEAYPYSWADASFSKQKDIVIAKDKVSADLSNFPVLLDIYDSDLRIDVQADAADLMFTDSSNTKLAHEIELFDQTGNGTHAHLIAWVNVPTLFNNTDTLVSMYYGNSEILNQENPEAVWDSSFKGVWHLDDDPSGTVYDSTLNNNDGTSGGSMTPSDLTSGKISEGIDFDGINDYIGFPDPLSTQSMTLSCWVYLNAASADWITIAMRSDGISWFDWQLYARASDAETLAYRAVFRTVYPGTSEVGSDFIFTTGNWYYISAEHNGTHNLFYVNGTLVEVDTEPDSVGDSDSDVWIGGNEIWGEYLQGMIDEFRVSAVSRSEAWIATEYNNQYDPTSFFNIGLEYEFDFTPPVINNFGVEDLGTGTGTFWANITDADSGVDSALLKINGTEYSMSTNGTHWIKQLSVEFAKYYIYQIVNASDVFGNYLSTPSSNKNYTFNFDTVAPDVLDWEYYDDTGPYGTFKANISDSWGVIDMVIVNVTEGTILAGESWAEMWVNASGYMNDTIEMGTGTIKFTITVNDTAGNSFTSSEHQGYVPLVNQAPEASGLTLSRDENT
ncbi:MAG: DUF2341 domain-containing protein, partial [Candidatus Hodarchaeales archaeon]